jgi:hypothetical protein
VDDIQVVVHKYESFPKLIISMEQHSGFERAVSYSVEIDDPKNAKKRWRNEGHGA